MSTGLLLLVCLIGRMFAEKPPDVQCLVVHLDHVFCSWNKPRTPAVNYTFSSWFDGSKEIYCSNYLRENNTNIGCNRPYEKLDRFSTFYTVLTNGNKTYRKQHDLKERVKLHPPTNLTVQMESDSNLWFYWNQTQIGCVESNVQFRTNRNKWGPSAVIRGTQSFYINLPSSKFTYELQVQSKMTESCGGSIFWSDWSEPVVWGSNNSTDSNPVNNSMSVWTPALYTVGALVLLLLVLMLVQHERLRVILIPVVPKPSLITNDIENWLQLSKGLKEDSKANYNERACPVREYIYVSQSDSDSSGSADNSGLSVATNQTDCSVSIAVTDRDNAFTAFSSSKI